MLAPLNVVSSLYPPHFLSSLSSWFRGVLTAVKTCALEC
jgi:hypothetical protein